MFTCPVVCAQHNLMGSPPTQFPNCSVPSVTCTWHKMAMHVSGQLTLGPRIWLHYIQQRSVVRVQKKADFILDYYARWPSESTF